MATKGIPNKEKAQKNLAYPAGTAFDFYSDSSMMNNGTKDEAKDYAKVKGVMIENFRYER